MSVTATRSEDSTMPGIFGYAATASGRTMYNRDVFRPPPPTKSSSHSSNIQRRDLKSPRSTNSNPGNQHRQASRTSSYNSNNASSSYRRSQPQWQSNSDQTDVRKRPRLDLHQRRLPSPRPSSRTPLHTTSRPSTVSSSYFSTYDGASDSSLQPSFSQSTAATSQYSDFDAASPSPLINSSYRLAGGLDAPTASYEKRLEDIATREVESDWRVDRFWRDSAQSSVSSGGLMDQASGLEMRSASFVGDDGKFHRVSSPRTPCWDEDSKSKGLKRGFDDASVASNSPRSKSLSGWNIRSTAWALTGGLAAKAISFCVSAAFGGFRAGGGIAYQMKNGVLMSRGGNGKVKEMTPSQDVFSSQYQPRVQSNMIVPGGFFDDNTAEDDVRRQLADSRMWTDSTPTGDRAMSSQLDRSNLRNDWQIIDHTDDNGSSSPARKRSRASVAGSSWAVNSWEHQTSTNSSFNRPSTTSGASYASPRSKTATSSYTTSATSTAPPFLRRTSSTASTKLRSPGRLSRPSSSSSYTYTTTTNPISPRRPLQSQPSFSTATTTKSAPFSPERAATQTRRILKQSAKDDEKLAQMNAQMREMIRIGKEALGTRIDVFDSDAGTEDEGYAEGTMSKGRT